MEDKISDLMGKSMKERLADMLLMLKNNYGVNSDHTLNMTLSMDELASFLGTTKSSVYSLLSDFKRAHLIDIQDNRIQVLSEKELESIAHPG
jgi:CRP-like cAMP-binding protein